MYEFFKNQQFILNSMIGAIEHDDRPRDPMPSDAEIDDMFEKNNGQSESEAYRLSH
jgi:hypothetical protein